MSPCYQARYFCSVFRSIYNVPSRLLYSKIAHLTKLASRTPQHDQQSTTCVLEKELAISAPSAVRSLGRPDGTTLVLAPLTVLMAGLMAHAPILGWSITMKLPSVLIV